MNNILKIILLFAFLSFAFNADADGKCTSGNCYNGKGTMTWDYGDKYTGDWANGKRTGKGTFTFANRTKYTGDWRNDKLHGKGTMTYANGDKFTGDFVNDTKTGQGTYTWTSGNQYTGDFVNDTRTGKGTFEWDCNFFILKVCRDSYIGDFVNGKMEGKGTYRYADGNIETGYWVDDKYWGTVEEWDAKVAKEKADKEIEKERERLTEVAKKKAYVTIYSACLLDKGSDVDMQVDAVKNEVMNECRTIAENPSWFENFKYN